MSISQKPVKIHRLPVTIPTWMWRWGHHVGTDIDNLISSLIGDVSHMVNVVWWFPFWLWTWMWRWVSTDIDILIGSLIVQCFPFGFWTWTQRWGHHVGTNIDILILEEEE